MVFGEWNITKILNKKGVRAAALISARIVDSQPDDVVQFSLPPGGTGQRPEVNDADEEFFFVAEKDIFHNSAVHHSRTARSVWSAPQSGAFVSETE
jgi:hypothetical protein